MALTDNLKFYYACEQNAATKTVTDSASLLNGTSVRNTNLLSTTGKINNGFSFASASGDIINTNSNTGIQNGDARSISFWHNSPNLTANTFTGMGIGANDQMFDVRINTNKYMINFYGTNDFLTTFTPNVGSWEFVCVTYDGTVVTVYVNNSTPQTKNVGAVSTGNSAFYIGRWSYNTAANLTALIDEVSLWSRCLTSTEVSTLYNSGSGFAYPFVTSSMKDIIGGTRIIPFPR